MVRSVSLPVTPEAFGLMIQKEIGRWRPMAADGTQGGDTGWLMRQGYLRSR
jgi:hypothetical protein